jgi:hypothetical protein
LSRVTWQVPGLLDKEEKGHSSTSIGGNCNTLKREKIVWPFQLKIGKIVNRNRGYQHAQKSGLTGSPAVRFKVVCNKPGLNTCTIKTGNDKPSHDTDATV